MYEHGNGREADYEQAKTWYEKAVRPEQPDAAYNLGWMYENGEGMPQDYVKGTDPL